MADPRDDDYNEEMMNIINSTEPYLPINQNEAEPEIEDDGTQYLINFDELVENPEQQNAGEVIYIYICIVLYANLIPFIVCMILIPNSINSFVFLYIRSPLERRPRRQALKGSKV